MSAHNDAAFLRMFLMVLGALVLFTVIILIAANRITGSVDEARGPDPRLQAAVVDRIKPIGSVNVARSAAAPAASDAPAQSPAELVASACNACHVAGVLGAPIIGDKAVWQQRMQAAGGVDGLTSSAIAGKGNMPPKGGAMVSDAEIRAAVEHMLQESGIEVAGGAAAAPPPAAAPEPAPESAASGMVGSAQSMASDAMEAASSMAAAAMPGPAPAPAPAAAPAAESSPEPASAAAPAAGFEPDLAKGKQIYDTACFVCHLTGAAGAPMLTDKAAWAPRIAQGMDTLYSSVLNGKGNMPPKGGRIDIADPDIKSAVAYMVEQAK